MSDLLFPKILIVSVLLCCHTQAQSQPSKVQTSKKPKSQISKVEPESQPTISKDFKPIARKAFQALDNLKQHFWEDYDSDAAWTPRQMAAENARDDLREAANTSMEKTIFSYLDTTLFRLTYFRHNMKAGLSTINEIDSVLKKEFGPCYIAVKEKAGTGEGGLEQCGTDPAGDAQFYYNQGAELAKAGEADQAIASFDKAIAADPNKAEAYYQKGVNLIAKETIDKNGKVIPAPGTEEALNKYLELQPNGPFAEAAKGLLQSIGATVKTSYGKKP